MRLGRAKDCYKNATNAVLDCPAWRYVEGYAHHRLGIIAEHAWAVDEQGRVIETTWPDAGTAYVGVPFDEAALRRAICATPCRSNDPSASFKRECFCAAQAACLRRKWPPALRGRRRFMLGE
jgi:hypothetical protein